MAKEIKQEQVQLTVTANGNSARKELNKLDMDAQKLKNTMRDLAAAGKKNSDEYKNAAESLKKVEEQMNKVRKSIDINKMTMRELNAELRKLKGIEKDVEPLSKAYWENKKAMDAVIARQKRLRTGMSEFGQMVNKYKDQIVFGAMAAGAAALYSGISNIIKVNVEFEKSLKNLQAITGVGAQDLKFYASAAKEIGLTTTTSASDAVEAFKLIASAKPDLLNAKESLVAVTKEAIHLANASGLSLPEAATRLTDAMNQFSAPAREAAKYVNVLAEGARVSAAEVPDITSSLLEFGVAAKSSNVSISESVALIETLAEKGLKGAEAGTKLRNVIAKGFSPKGLDKAAIADLEAMGVNLDVLSNKNLTLQQRLEELAKIKDNDIALTHVFGLENKIAAQVLLENTGRVNELSAALGKEGLTTAIDQANVNLDTLGSAANRLTNTWNAVMTDENGGLNGFLKKVINLTTKAILGLDHLFKAETWGNKRDRDFNIGVRANDKVLNEYKENLGGMSKTDIGKELVDKTRTLNYLVKSTKGMADGEQLDNLRLQILLVSGMKDAIYNHLKEIQKTEQEAANKSMNINQLTVADTEKKVKSIDTHIKKLKEQHSEFFKLTGFETEQEFFDAMDKENAYQDKLKISRDKEEQQRLAQNNIDAFGYDSIHSMMNATSNADVDADKDAADKAKREAKEEEERQAFLKLEQDKRDAQDETFENWLANHKAQINNTLDGFKQSAKMFAAFDDFKRVAEQAEIDRLGENSAKSKEIKIQQARRAKLIALFEAGINTASAIVEALPNVPLSIMAGITGGIQIGTIAATPIPEAKYGKKRVSGPSHENGGMNVIDNNTGKAVLNIEGGEGIIPAATVNANEKLIDAMLNNYGRPIGIDWLYKNSTASVKNGGFTGSSSTINNYTTNNYAGNGNNDSMAALIDGIKRVELALQNKEQTIEFSLYDLKKKQKEVQIIERNAGLI